MNRLAGETACPPTATPRPACRYQFSRKPNYIGVLGIPGMLNTLKKSMFIRKATCAFRSGDTAGPKGCLRSRGSGSALCAPALPANCHQPTRFQDASRLARTDLA